VIELRVTFDPTTGRTNVLGEAVDAMPCLCLTILASARQAVQQKAALAELAGGRVVVAPAGVLDRLPKLNGE